jgi:ParB-like chromosome segregation protein Spo0J
MKIEMWPISRPVPYEKNARKITDSTVDKVAASIKEYGFRQPLVVDPEGVVIAGHTRLKAAQKLGLDKIPVHVAHGLTAAQIKAYRLMDNKSHETLWDVEKLGEELGELRGLEFDLGLTGFEDFEFDTLLPDGDSAPSRLYQTEVLKLAELKEHPRNFRTHPDDQLDHIIKSIEQNGIYRSVVVASDNTILAGHGLVAACRKMGKKRIQVSRVNIAPDSIEALKILIGDNDIQDRGEVNDRILTDTLKEIKERGELLGTGYDDMMLANLLYVTRPASEIKDMDRAAEWVGAGMPEFDNAEDERAMKLTVSFRSEQDRENFVEQIGLDVRSKSKTNSWSTWWPPLQDDDTASVKFETTAKK